MTLYQPGQRRILAARGQGHVPAEFLQSIFATELLQPSRKLWLVSPWISDITVINNSGRRFASLDSTWESDEILLSDFIATYLARGSSVSLVMNTDSHNRWIRRQLAPLIEEHPDQIDIRLMEEIHAKGIVSDHFALTGSMNITFNGININSEYIDYNIEPTVVHETLAQFEEYFGSELS